MADPVPKTHVRIVYPYCDECHRKVPTRVEMLLPRPQRGSHDEWEWLAAARREGAAKFEREHAAECRGRAR